MHAARVCDATDQMSGIPSCQSGLPSSSTGARRKADPDLFGEKKSGGHVFTRLARNLGSTLFAVLAASILAIRWRSCLSKMSASSSIARTLCARSGQGGVSLDLRPTPQCALGTDSAARQALLQAPTGVAGPCKPVIGGGRQAPAQGSVLLEGLREAPPPDTHGWRIAFRTASSVPMGKNDKLQWTIKAPQRLLMEFCGLATG